MPENSAGCRFAGGVAKSNRAKRFIFVVMTVLGAAIASNQLIFSPPLFAGGLVPVGTQPHGGLTGKIVYTHGGHGITAANQQDGAWTFQRGPGNEMIEDLGNIDQMAFLVDYLFRAGATVAPLRPVGYQTNEVVLDNDDAGVTFEGDWSNGNRRLCISAVRATCRIGRLPLRRKKRRTRATRRTFRKPGSIRSMRGPAPAAIGRPTSFIV